GRLTGPQPRRGAGARGDDPRVAPPARSRVRHRAAHLPLHSGSRCRGGDGGRGRRGRRRRRSGRGRLARDRLASGEELTMDHLLRGLAPISDTAWAALEQEAKSRITTFLAARKLVDFEGPRGWG